MVKSKRRWMAAPLLALTTMATLATASIPVIQSYSQPVMAHADAYDNGLIQSTTDTVNKQQEAAKKAGAKLAKGITKAKAKKEADKAKKPKVDKSNLTQDGGDSGRDGNYKLLQPPSMLATAMYDGLGIATSAANFGKGKDDPYKTFNANVSTIMGVQNASGHTLFSNTGAMYGALGLSGNSATANVIQKQSADTTFLNKHFGKQGLYYYKFGMAYTDLSTHAYNSKVSNMSTKSFVDGFNGLAATTASFGLTVLKMINPMPVVLTMFNSDVRKDPKYAKGNDKNLFIGFINDHAMFYGITDFFGDHVMNGPLTMANMIVIVIMFVSLGLAGITTIMNGRQWGITARKFMSKVFIFSVAIPLASLVFTFGLNTLSDVVSGKQSKSQASVIRENLDLGDWAKAAKFGLPANTTLKIESGQFRLTDDLIQKINLYTMFMAGVIKDDKPTKANIKAATKYIQQRAYQSDNRTTINWQDTTRLSDGNPYSTSGLLQVANSLGQNQKISLSKKDMNNIAYLSYASLNTSDGKSFHMDGAKQDSYFGLTPLSAYNILNTNFDKSGLSIQSNINSPQVPTIAVGADMYGSASLNAQTGAKPSGIMMFFLNIIMMAAAFKALARIFTTGFGSVLHGGGSATFGTATGWGELLGGVIALTFGIIGLSLVITGVQYGFDALYQFVVGAVNKALANNPLMKMLDGIKDDVSGIWMIGGLLEDCVNGIISLIVTIVMLMMAPKFIKIPIEAYGSWIEGLPGVMAEKVQEIENRFTGDYRAGGRVGSNIRNATEKQFAENKQKHDQKSRERSDALKTAGGVLLGMGAAKGLGFLGLGKGKKSDSVNPQTGTTGDNGTSPDSQPNTAPDDSPEGVTNTTNTGDNKTEQNNNKSDSKSGDEMSHTDANSEESVNAQGDNVKDDVNNLEGNTEAVEAIDDVDSSESVAPAGDSVGSADSVNNPSEQQGNPDAEVNGDQSVNSTQNNNVDKSNSSDRDVDSSQSVNNDNANTTEGNDVDRSNTSADATNDINSSASTNNANDARKVDKGQSVSNQGNLNKNSVNNGRSTDNTTNVGKNQSVSNTTKNSKGSGINNKAKGIAGKIKSAGPQSKGAGKSSAVKSVIGNITKQSKGTVGDKERVSMAVAHAAAAMVGAQGLTQSGMNHIQRRDASSAFKPANGHQQSVQGSSQPNKVQDVKTGGLKAEADAPNATPNNGRNQLGAKPAKSGQSFFKTVKGFDTKDSKGK